MIILAAILKYMLIEQLYQNADMLIEFIDQINLNIDTKIIILALKLKELCTFYVFSAILAAILNITKCSTLQKVHPSNFDLGYTKLKENAIKHCTLDMSG